MAKYVECSDIVPDNFICREVTLGKRYEVIKESEVDYLLIDDTGCDRYYVKEYFNEVEEK